MEIYISSIFILCQKLCYITAHSCVSPSYLHTVKHYQPYESWFKYMKSWRIFSFIISTDSELIKSF